MKSSLQRLFTLLLITSFFIPTSLFAAPQLTFDPEYIIPDEEFFDVSSMTQSDVEIFLESKRSTLLYYTSVAADGALKRASQIIWEAAQAYGINPKVVLVLLQKEQSLIENPSPSQYNYDWATGFARCDSCLATDPKVVAYKGYGTQVDRAAWRLVYYTTNPEKFNFRSGLTRDIDGLSVTPKNKATAALYNYTPHLRGNFNFWKLWYRYFGKIYPDGTLVQENGSPDIWLIQNGVRRKFSSVSSLLSRYSMSQIIKVPARELDSYPKGDPIRFPRYSLLQSPNGAIFLYTDAGTYGITSREAFRKLGFNPEEVIRVGAEDLAAIPLVGYLSATSTHPAGELYQLKSTGGIFFVKDGVKHPILEKPVLQTAFRYRPIKKVSEKDLALFQKGTPALFLDGTLVKSTNSPAVFVISNGQKRPFASAETFESLGYDWSQIVVSNGSTLEYHPLGDIVNLGADVEQQYPYVEMARR
jgi:hypothetical protein